MSFCILEMKLSSLLHKRLLDVMDFWILNLEIHCQARGTQYKIYKKQLHKTVFDTTKFGLKYKVIDYWKWNFHTVYVLWQAK